MRCGRVGTLSGKDLAKRATFTAVIWARKLLCGSPRRVSSSHPDSQLLKDCLPPEIWNVLKISTAPRDSHTHKSLIINLACGSTITREGTRFKLFEMYV